MKTICRVVLAVLPICVAASVHAQTTKKAPQVAKVTVPGQTQSSSSEPTTTIYKLVDEQGRVTYSNRPMKGAEVVDLEPITVLPSAPRPQPMMQQTASQNININNPDGSNSIPASSPLAAVVATSSGSSSAQVAMVQPILPNIEAATQKKRDESRRKILEDEMKAEQKLLADAVITLSATESDRSVIEQMRVAAAKQTPVAYAEARRNYEVREEKLKTLQASVSTHEKNLEALKKELAALR
jgi:hypothetical protein